MTPHDGSAMIPLDSSPARDRRVGTVLGAVAVHLLLTGTHAAAHLSIPVPIPGWQAVYAASVLIGLPAVGAALVARGRVRTGALLVLVAGLAALGFEGPLHFLIDTPDHVSNVADGAGLFAATAVLTTASDALLVVAGGAAAWRHRQGSAATSPTESST